MIPRKRSHPGPWLAGFAAVAVGLAAPALAETVTLRSGNAPVGSVDPATNCTFFFGSCPLSPWAFSPAEFASACTGAPSIVIGQHPAWIAGLSTDPAAQWVGVDAARSGAAALHCQRFTLTSIPSCAARLEMTFAGDDSVGDGLPDNCGTPAPAPNPVGAYLNGQPIVSPADWPACGFTWETSLTVADVRALLVLGDNTLHVYQRDMFGSPSGAIWTVTITTDPDGDGDLVADACDNCPRDGNPPNAAPTDCNGDGDATDPGETIGGQCDADGDGIGDPCDCLPLDASNPPLAPVDRIDVAKALFPAVRVAWSPVANAVGYNVYRGYVPVGVPFGAALGTLQCFGGGDLRADHVDDPLQRPGGLFFYLVTTYCTGQEASLGGDSFGVERWLPPFTRPACPEPLRDTDGDGIQDAEDVCPAVSDRTQADGDGDFIGDACDPCPLAFDPYGRDLDGDGIGDACDCDLDGDLVANRGRDATGADCAPALPDNCPANSNASQADGDGDAAGDACDVCPAIPDPGQIDSDRDGCGDACDAAPIDPLVGC